METRGKFLFHLTKTFFVISPEEAEAWTTSTRKNIMALIKQGFTREELYYMPWGEVQDYIRLLNSQIERENAAISSAANTPSSPEVSMAGNSMPGF